MREEKSYALPCYLQDRYKNHSNPNVVDIENMF